jgi:hypothetical protein
MDGFSIFGATFNDCVVVLVDRKRRIFNKYKGFNYAHAMRGRWFILYLWALRRASVSGRLLAHAAFYNRLSGSKANKLQDEKNHYHYFDCIGINNSLLWTNRIRRCLDKGGQRKSI